VWELFPNILRTVADGRPAPLKLSAQAPCEAFPSAFRKRQHPPGFLRSLRFLLFNYPQSKAGATAPSLVLVKPVKPQSKSVKPICNHFLLPSVFRNRNQGRVGPNFPVTGAGLSLRSLRLLGVSRFCFLPFNCPRSKTGQQRRIPGLGQTGQASSQSQSNQYAAIFCFHRFFGAEIGQDWVKLPPLRAQDEILRSLRLLGVPRFWRAMNYCLP
jgi:hypothetical protein